MLQASTDLQNPADALEFLAHVAEHNGTNQLPPIRDHRLSVAMSSGGTRRGSADHTPNNGAIDYAPLMRGHLSIEIIHSLLARYR